MPAAVTIVIERHTMRVIVAARFIMASFASVALLLVAIVTADDIAGDAAKDRTGDRSTGAAMGNGVADDAAADRANRRSCITTALAIRGFRCERGKTQRKCCEGT